MGKEIKSKLKDREQVFTIFGYAINHTGDTYQVKNDSTGEVQITRDVVWTKGRKGNKDDDFNIDEDNDDEPKKRRTQA